MIHNQKYPPHILELIKKSQEKARQLKKEIEKQKDLEKYKTKEIANFFWTGELSECEVLCIKSFVQKGFHAKLWSYENLKVDGAESCDASLVLPKSDLTKYKQINHHDKLNDKIAETSSAFSDAFRFHLVNKFGGWWFDADCYCLKSAEDYYNLRKGKSIVAGLEDFISIASGAFYADNQTSKLLIDELEKTCIQYNYDFPKWGLIGPLLITKVIHDNKLYDGVLSNKFFYSIQFPYKDLFFKSDLNKLSKSYITESYLTHIWHIKDLNKKKEKGSLLDELFNSAYNNNEAVHQNLLYKQNYFYNRFIVISDLYHKILNQSPDNKILDYVSSNDTIQEVEDKMRRFIEWVEDDKGNFVKKDIKKHKEIANFFWTGELSECEVLCIKSFVQKGFHAKLWSYENLKVDGAESCDASLVLPKSDLTKYKQKRGDGKSIDTKASFADIFRCHVINKFGGWWFDADCYCLKSAEDYYNLRKGKSIVAGLQNLTQIANGVFYADNQTSKLLIDELEKKFKEYNYYFPKWGMPGPEFMTQFIHDNKLYDGVLNNKFFYSIQYDYRDLFFKSDLNKLAKSYIKESYLTHIWHMSDSNMKKEKGSLLDELFNGTYKNDESPHKDLSYKQNYFYNRFIVISDLYHKILNQSPDEETLLKYMKFNNTVEQIRIELLNKKIITIDKLDIKKHKEIANFFWTGELSECEVLCIKSFVQKGFHAKLWSYENLKVDGAESCDASLVLPKSDLTKYKQTNHPDKLSAKIDTSSAFSDAFRYNVVNKFGGWWFDADCYCLKSAEDFYELRKGKSIVAGLEKFEVTASGAFYSDNKISKLLVDELEKTCIQYNYNFPLWGLIGPLLITKVIHDNKLYDGVLNNKFFYSIQYEHRDFYFKSDLNKLAKSCIIESYLTHIWNLRDLNNKKEKGSLLDELFGGVYTNNESPHQGLLYKQNKYYNRFIEISNLHHKVLKRSPSNKEIIKYIKSSNTLKEIEDMLQKTIEWVEDDKGNFVKKNKEIANFFWTGELSELEISCIKSFVQKGFHAKLWSYENLKVDGAESCDASLVLPKSDLTKYKQRRGDGNSQETSSAFSDAFRYNVVNKFGGWWFDADCYCLKSAEDYYNLRKGKSIVAGLESLGYPYVGSAAFYVDDKVCKLFINELEKTCIQYNYNFPLWGLIGPLLITKVVHDNKLYDEVLLHDHFFSIDFRKFDLFFKSDLNKLAKSYIKESYLTHIWHSSGLYKNMEKGSLLNELINNTYINNEIVDKNLLDKQNNFRNRFIEISNLHHKVLKRSPSNKEIIRYITTNHTIEQIKNKLLN